MATETDNQAHRCELGGRHCRNQGENCYLAHLIKSQSSSGGDTKENLETGIGMIWSRPSWDRFVARTLELSRYFLEGRRYVKRVANSITVWKERKGEFTR